MRIILSFLIISLLNGPCLAITLDTNGYLTYCPCMGRFGNQADHFLGVLSFAQTLNRTLILPPWVEYHKGEVRSVQVPFDTYFKVEALQKYHRVMLMGTFMQHLAPEAWPPAKRVSFCYMERKNLHPSKTDQPDCHAKDGNPFGSFWDTYSIDFAASEFYGPLSFDVHHNALVQHKWQTNYQPALWPVLAFTGAPASYPVQQENRDLQRYVQWNDKYVEAARKFIKDELPRGAFIGVHLRNGIDWVRACEHIHNSQHLFASPQCLGYGNERGTPYPELCMPSKEMIIRQLKRLIKNVRQTHTRNEVRSIFVASDSNHMIPELNAALARMNVSAHKLPKDDPHLDLAILGMSNHFIGNCISSYTAFVKRERDVKGFPSYFWAYPKEKDRQHSKVHEEL